MPTGQGPVDARCPMKRSIPGVLFLAGALLVCSGWLFYYSGNAVVRAADKVMQDEVARGNFSGSVLMSRNGRVIFEKAYGAADAERNVANTNTTRFCVGSITKPFTAVLIMQLEQQRKLQVTNGVCHYLAACPAGWEAIKLHHLLSHTSGIFDFTKSADADELRGAPQAQEQMLARFMHQPLASAPGKEYSYSNSNYLLLGLVIEKAAGEPYSAVLRRQILEPLGLRNTGVAAVDELVPQRAQGYRRDRDGRVESVPPVHHSWLVASGSLYSTVEDLARFSEALATEKLLPRASVEQMWVAVAGDYGYGWRTPGISAHTFARRMIEHGGRVPGFHAMLRRFVDDGLTIVVLSNRMDADPLRVANGLSAVAFGVPHSSVFDRDSIQLTVEERRRFLGDYEFDGKIYTIAERDGKLVGRSVDLPETEILAESPSVLYLPGSENTMVAIENSAGEVLGLSFRVNGSKGTATKKR
jgi:CubicO group peptidase (beta-lactamase class C family)